MLRLLRWKLPLMFGNRQARRPRPPCLPRLEVLEDRLAPALRVWTGAVSDAWLTPANWAGNEAPQAGDDLLFPAGVSRLGARNDFATDTAFSTIAFTGSGYVLSGNRIVLTGGIFSAVPDDDVRPGTLTPTNTVQNSVRLGGSATFASLFPGTTLALSDTASGKTLNTNSFTVVVEGAGHTAIGHQVVGSGGVTKNGSGTFDLGCFGFCGNTYSGPTVINAGTLLIWNNGSLGSPVAGTTVNPGGMLMTGAPTIINTSEPLTLSGGGVEGELFANKGGAIFAGGASSTTWTGAVTLAGDASIGSTYTGGIVFTNLVRLNGHTFTLRGDGDFTFGGPLEDGAGGSGSLVVENARPFAGPWYFTGPSTYTGPTTIRHGIMTLTGGGTLVSTSIRVESNGTLRIDNSGAEDRADRVPDDATISLDRGGLAFVGNGTAGSVSSETVGAVVLDGGHNRLSSQRGTGIGATATLTAAALVRNPGTTFNATGDNLGTPGNRILFTEAPATVGNAGGILPYGTSAGEDFATYGPDGIARFTNYVNSIAAAGPGDTVKLADANETVAVDKTINALYLRTGNSSADEVTIERGATLTLAGGGLLLVSTNIFATPTIRSGTTGAGTATLHFGSEGLVYRNLGLATAFLTTALSGSNGVTFSGEAGTLQVAPPASGNVYTGGTWINAGTLSWPATAANLFGGLAGGTLTLSGGFLSTGGPGTPALPNPVALAHADVSLSNLQLTGAVTLTGINRLAVGSPTTISGPISGTGMLVVRGGNLVLAPGAEGNSYSGGTVLAGGTITLGSTGSVLGSGPLVLWSGLLATTLSGGALVPNLVFVGNGATPGLGGTGPSAQPLTFTGPLVLLGRSTLTVNNTATFAGLAVGSGSVQQSGTGTLSIPLNLSSGGTSVTNGTLLLDGLQLGPAAVTGQGTLGGTGFATVIAAGSETVAGVGLVSGTVNPGSPASGKGVLSALAASFGTGGTLRLQVSGYGGAGVDYDRLDLGSGVLIVGGSSRLTLDLAGLSSSGTVGGAIRYGSLIGNVPQFSQVTLINNPNNYQMALQYGDEGLDLVISPSRSVAPLVGAAAGASAPLPRIRKAAGEEERGEPSGGNGARAMVSDPSSGGAAEDLPGAGSGPEQLAGESDTPAGPEIDRLLAVDAVFIAEVIE